VGDHCTNIAEAVTYIVTGQIFVDPRPKQDILTGEPKD